VSVTLRLDGLEGELRLIEEDLTHTGRQKIGASRDGVVAPLGTHLSQMGQCCWDFGPSVAYTQYFTSVDTETTGLTEHTFCIRNPDTLESRGSIRRA
jgi:hypothetical protein